MSLSDRIQEGKKANGNWRRCSHTTCQRLYETSRQSPLCPTCTKMVQDKLAEELMKHGYGYTH